MKKLKKESQVPARLPQEITDVVRLIQSDQLADWKIEKRRDGVTKFHGVAPDGGAIIIQKKSVGSYSRTTTETMAKPGTVGERRVLVRELRGEGMTQMQIAERTGYSQKTISNDCTHLGI